MLFNTLQFAVFFIVVYSLYLVLRHKWQNRMLLVASYVFYGTWNWKFLSLLLISTFLDYFCALKIHESRDIRKRKLLLWCSIVGNLTILSFFKYFNFFATNLQFLLSRFNLNIPLPVLNIILPVGISFYTFQTMSYTFDVYRNDMEPTRSFLDFALFVAFFPQLVAGPIERAKHLLPQILSPRKLNPYMFREGCYSILWGLFQKTFVADNLAQIVDPVFASELPYNGVRILIAAYAFAFQIYCDFAGYSNIARGLGKCMGFDIMVNFNLPYFATNPREFWKRWHISLSTFLRDYLYNSLGGNRKGTIITYRNLAITMLLGGLWHGASWTFVIWGIYHGVLLIIYRLFKPLLEKVPSPKGLFEKRLWFAIRAIFFFHLVCLGWLIFRAQSMAQVYNMVHSLIFNFSFVKGIGIKAIGLKMMLVLWVLIIIQLIQYWKNDLLIMLRAPSFCKIAFYYICILLILFFGVFGGKEFIYFQF